MRLLVASLFTTLDGVVEAPKKWHFRYFDDAMGEVIGAAAEKSDAILLSRRTYEEFAAFWPSQGSDVPMADYLNKTPKHVVSTTLDSLEWANSSLVTADVAEEVATLKEQRGKNIQVIGRRSCDRCCATGCSTSLASSSTRSSRSAAQARSGTIQTRPRSDSKEQAQSVRRSVARATTV
jgi:RibD C-terminal domain